MCCCGSRCAIIFAGIFCLIESICWTTLAFLGIALYNCELEIEDENIFYFYFLYFFNRDCAQIPKDLEFPDITIPSSIPPITGLPDIPTALPEWPETFSTAELTIKILISYGCVSVLWFVTSIIIIICGIMKVRNKLAYIPWIIVAAANLILDVVAAVIYGIQISQSYTLEGVLELIGVTNLPDKSWYEDVLANEESLLVISPLVMTIFAARGIIFWIFNLILFICVIVAVTSLGRQRKNPPLVAYPHQIAATHNIHTDNRDNTLSGLSNPNYSGDSDPYSNYLNLQPKHDPKKGGWSYTNGEPEPGSLPPRIPTMAHRKPQNELPRPSLYMRPNEPVYSEYDSVNHTPWFHNPEQEKQPQSVNPVEEPHLPRVIKRVPEIPRAEPKPAAIDLHRRPPSFDDVQPLSKQTAHSITPVQDFQSKNTGAANQRLSNSMPPEELRSQLPWSYFNPHNAQIKDRLKQRPESEEVDKPPVPVPDYTLHFGKSQRPSTSGGWSDQDGASRSSTSSSLAGGKQLHSKNN